jgi:large subunit ribosomal protein L1
MAKNRSKRYEAAKKAVDPSRKYPLAEAVKVLKGMPPAKYDMTVTLSMHLGVDPKQSDQMVRGTTPLPHGSGKSVRVLVFASGAAAEAAKAAGAEFVGFEDMIKKCTEGFADFDVAISTPAAMAEVRKLGKVARSPTTRPRPCKKSKPDAWSSNSTKTATSPFRSANFPSVRTLSWPTAMSSSMPWPSRARQRPRASSSRA